MARDPNTKLFSFSTGVPVFPDAILNSGDYNAAMGEIAVDFNAPLPVSMGGTGSASLEEALPSIGGVSTFYLDSIFVGVCAYFLRPAPPSGWLIADGRQVNRQAFSLLFDRISTTWGNGNGATTFNLPDMRGEFVRGLDQSRGADTGRVIGAPQADDNASHTHTGTAEANSGHNHAIFRTAIVSGPSPPVNLVLLDLQSGAVTNYQGTQTSQVTSGVANHSHTVSIASTGSEFRPRNVALLGCIFAGISST